PLGSDAGAAITWTDARVAAAVARCLRPADACAFRGASLTRHLDRGGAPTLSALSDSMSIRTARSALGPLFLVSCRAPPQDRVRAGPGQASARGRPQRACRRSHTAGKDELTSVAFDLADHPARALAVHGPVAGLRAHDRITPADREFVDAGCVRQFAG